GLNQTRTTFAPDGRQTDFTTGIQTKAVVKRPKRCGQSPALRAANPQKLPGRQLPEPSRYFGGNRCPALPTAGDLANEGASCSRSVWPWSRAEDRRLTN